MQRDLKTLIGKAQYNVKNGGTIIVVAMAVVVFSTILVWLIFPSKIETYGWHLWSGNSIQVGRFNVPVPIEWHVHHLNSGFV